jgi:hypothetical protein
MFCRCAAVNWRDARLRRSMSNPGIGANCIAVAMMSSFLPLLAIDRCTTVNHVAR